MLHDLIQKYIHLMKHRLWWYGDFDYLASSIPRRCFKFYLKSRWFLSILFFIATCIGLHSREFMGLYDGTFVYGPLLLQLAVMVAMTTLSGEGQGVLTMKLNNCFILHNANWMEDIRNEYTAQLWRMVRYFVLYNNFVFVTYMTVPLVLDTVLHFGFDYIENPVLSPLPLTPFYGDDTKWNFKYYFITLMNWWIIVEFATVIQAPLLNFAILSNYALTEMRIFREQIKMLELVGRSEDDVDRQMKDLIKSHNNLIDLIRSLREVLGLPCAFNSIFLSLAITLSLFSALMTDNIVVNVSYSSGFFLNIFTGLSYCSLGQRLEDESEEIFLSLSNLPWIKCTPKVRKDLNMIIRQAKTPLIVDYHGRSTMNNRTFMQMLRSSYSYFTLLQSMAKKGASTLD